MKFIKSFKDKHDYEKSQKSRLDIDTDLIFDLFDNIIKDELSLEEISIDDVIAYTANQYIKSELLFNSCYKAIPNKNSYCVSASIYYKSNKFKPDNFKGEMEKGYLESGATFKKDPRKKITAEDLLLTEYPNIHQLSKEFMNSVAQTESLDSDWQITLRKGRDFAYYNIYMQFKVPYNIADEIKYREDYYRWESEIEDDDNN